MNAVCPCCGVHRLTPRPPRIDDVPWGDCACSDRVTCVAHQIDSTDAPSRPTDAMLAEKGQQIYVRRLKEHAETVEHFARMQVQRALLEGICSQFEGAVAHADWRAAGSKGMHVPFTGDFASAVQLPSVVGRMRWWAKEIRSVIGEDQR